VAPVILPKVSRSPSIKVAVNDHLAHLRQSNPFLDNVLKQNPGVQKLVERFHANGAVAQPKPTDAKSKVVFEMWSHSKASGGMPVEPFKDVIFVWQNDPTGKSKLDFGRQSVDGKLIAVHRLDQLAFKTEAAAKATADEKSPVAKEFEPGKWALVSDDKTYRGSYEWENMEVTAHGEPGQKFDINWAILSIDADGQVKGGGWPGGWSGRTTQGVIGKDVHKKMAEH
jgi:hypothetical protein